MQKKKEVRPRYPIRQGYIKGLKVVGVLVLTVLLSPLYTHKSINVPDETNSNPFIGSKTLDLVSKNKDSERGLVLEFAIDDDDQSILKELSNLKYTAEVKTSKGNDQNIKVYIQSITDEYFVMTLENVPKDYYAMRVTIQSEMIDKNVSMDLPMDLIYYVHEENVTTKIKDKHYLSHFVDYRTSKLKDKQRTAKEEIQALEAGIKLNEELVDKLKGQLNYQTFDDQELTEDKINIYNLENESSKTKINDQDEVIKKLQEKIESITVENLKQSMNN